MKQVAAAGEMKDKAGRAVESGQAGTWIEWLARFGYAIRGVLYAVVGLLALQVAFGVGGATTTKGGALTTIAGEPFGKFLMVLVLIGLIGYSLWGLVRAILDPLHRGGDPKGLAQRAGYLVSAVSYGALIIPAFQLISGSGAKSGGAGTDWTAKLMSEPFGQWLVGIAGLIGIAGGLGQIYQGYNGSYKKDFKSWEMSARTMEWATWAARIGMAARGVVFALAGFFLIQAALTSDPKKAKGLDGALQTLAHQPYGPWLLGFVAAGLVAFGIYSMICARYIKIRPTSR
ncbi:MAG: DUF1206 domain-containing protein [Chloroflexia bacterium]